MNPVIILNKIYNFFIGRIFSHFFSSTIIRSVEVDYEGYVYNLSIEDDETYLANDIIVHNCRSLRVMLVERKYEIPGLEGTRASETGQVSANLSYRGWLKLQPKAVRERVNIKKTYSLAELAALEPVTFL